MADSKWLNNKPKGNGFEFETTGNLKPKFELDSDSDLL